MQILIDVPGVWDKPMLAAILNHTFGRYTNWLTGNPPSNYYCLGGLVPVKPNGDSEIVVVGFVIVDKMRMSYEEWLSSFEHDDLWLLCFAAEFVEPTYTLNDDIIRQYKEKGIKKGKK